MEKSVRVAGVFDNSAGFASAVFGLETRGVDRAAISILAGENFARECLKAVGAHRGPISIEHDGDALVLEDDSQPMRVLFTSLAASVAALIASGVVMAASGGAAFPALAAAFAAGASAGGLAELVGRHVAPEHALIINAAVRDGAALLVARVPLELASDAERLISEAGGRLPHVFGEVHDTEVA